jgi:endo-1,4-beta-xylanase
VALLALAGARIAPAAPLDGCAVTKLKAAGAACSGVMRAWGAWERHRDDGRREAALAHDRDALAAKWAVAEVRSSQAGADCGAATASPDDTAARLEHGAATLAAAVSAPLDPGMRAHRRCGAKLLGLAGGACRRALGTESAFMRARFRGRVGTRKAPIAAAMQQLEAKWAALLAGGCPAGVAIGAVARAVLQIVDGVAGDATTLTLRETAALADVAVGAAITPLPVPGDPLYEPTLAAEFDSLTSENVMKWEPIQPAPDVYDFAAADAHVAFAEAHGMRVRGHNLVWGRLQLPAYVQSATTADELRGFMADHIATVAGHYAGRVARWDVVNEPLTVFGTDDANGGYDPNVFFRLLGPGYVAEALALAHAADPDAKLFVNEFLTLIPGAKQDRFFQLASDLVAAGAPLDGVGLQGHLGIFERYPTRAEVEASVARFAALGLLVEITEMDVVMSAAPGDDASRRALQHDVYADVLSGCLAVPACSGITFWGLSDTYSWIRPFFHIDDDPLPLGDGYARKPAYFGVRSGFLSRRVE